MVTRLTDRIYDLDMGLAFAIDRAHNKTIRCVETHLWLTEEGRAEDIILSAGEYYQAQGFGRVVISALFGKTRFSLRTEPGWITRIASALRGIRARPCGKQDPGTSLSFGAHSHKCE